jgi:hypothetical protein
MNAIAADCIDGVFLTAQVFLREHCVVEHVEAVCAPMDRMEGQRQLGARSAKPHALTADCLAWLHDGGPEALGLDPRADGADIV